MQGTSKGHGARPEHCPRNHEWLADAYLRDVLPHGPEARELVRQALAEGDVKALLRTRIGERSEIAAHKWDKEPLDQVYAIFEDGLMPITIAAGAGFGPIRVKGWVFVPLGSLRAIVEEHQAKPTRATEDKCRSWLIELMDEGGKKKTKEKYAEEAFSKFQILRRRFNPAWDDAIRATGDPHKWKKPGPVTQSS